MHENYNHIKLDVESFSTDRLSLCCDVADVLFMCSHYSHYLATGYPVIRAIDSFLYV